MLQKIFKDNFEDFKAKYDEKYAKTYGNYRIARIPLATMTTLSHFPASVFIYARPVFNMVELQLY